MSVNEKCLFGVVKGRKIEFKGGPFDNRLGPFVPDRLENGYFYGHHIEIDFKTGKETGKKTANFWAVFWHEEDCWDNCHWKIAS